MKEQEPNSTRTTMPEVLVIDDDSAYLRILSLQLSTSRIPCSTAATIDEAIDSVKARQSIGVVIVDYTIQGQDPAALIRRLTDVRPNLVLVGHSSLDRSRAFRELGVELFFRKPMSLTEFLNEISTSTAC